MASEELILCFLLMFYFLDNVSRLEQRLYLLHAFTEEKTPHTFCFFNCSDCAVDIGRLYWLSMVVVWASEVCSLPGIWDLDSCRIFNSWHRCFKIPANDRMGCRERHAGQKN